MEFVTVCRLFYRVDAARRMAGHFPLSPDTPQYAAPVIHDRHSCEIALGIILIVTPIAIFPDRAERPVACWQTPVEAHASSRCTRKLDEATSIPPGARHPYAACAHILVQKLVHGIRNASWQRGNYPYAACPVSRPSGSAALIKVAALLVADHQYAEVRIPRWASSSRVANVDLCVVGHKLARVTCRARRRDAWDASASATLAPMPSLVP